MFKFGSQQTYLDLRGQVERGGRGGLGLAGVGADLHEGRRGKQTRQTEWRTSGTAGHVKEVGGVIDDSYQRFISLSMFLQHQNIAQ